VRSMAPAWMQRNGLEWLYRLCQEPLRLTGRYVFQGPGFFLGVARQKLGLLPPDMAPTAAVPDYWG
jgi:UDP-N-acetyl-D-mannosaminuronic acid transferase (WecB/TagA/CpsF family)